LRLSSIVLLDLRPEAIFTSSVRKVLEKCVIEPLTFLNPCSIINTVATRRLALRGEFAS
jgi:hypothetical protein